MVTWTSEDIVFAAYGSLLGDDEAGAAALPVLESL